MQLYQWEINLLILEVKLLGFLMLVELYHLLYQHLICESKMTLRCVHTFLVHQNEDELILKHTQIYIYVAYIFLLEVNSQKRNNLLIYIQHHIPFAFFKLAFSWCKVDNGWSSLHDARHCTDCFNHEKGSNTPPSFTPMSSSRRFDHVCKYLWPNTVVTK